MNLPSAGTLMSRWMNTPAEMEPAASAVRVAANPPLQSASLTGGGTDAGAWQIAIWSCGIQPLPVTTAAVGPVRAVLGLTVNAGAADAGGAATTRPAAVIMSTVA